MTAKEKKHERPNKPACLSVVGTGWYTCFYKPMSQTEENSGGPSTNQQPAETAIKLEESSSIESILHSDKKITDREYIGKLERARLTKMIIPGESIFEEEDQHDFTNYSGEDYSMNGMEGYEELPEHNISLVLEKNSKRKLDFIPSTSFKQVPQQQQQQQQSKKNDLSHQEESDDGGIDLDKFLQKDQEIKELEFEKNLKEKYPFNSF
ncbi:predicted protein [Naegleria gruberi]|uniref:Predicted protein n=1 Tax=Naegleria gruberi TaxID=5762 RepID=D2V054_NAEGR|nr:uncharacterized protein NAEGRDRAFT_56690 [Naegleria gruberi]EFC49656.1 predicted protein [Naegleria gruberi]|eukprot:XP_002682400.1 predicted protein [Naegleria gruberi strain NEG-M]